MVYPWPLRTFLWKKWNEVSCLLMVKGSPIDHTDVCRGLDVCAHVCSEPRHRICIQYECPMSFKMPLSRKSFIFWRLGTYITVMQVLCFKKKIKFTPNTIIVTGLGQDGLKVSCSFGAICVRNKFLKFHDRYEHVRIKRRMKSFVYGNFTKLSISIRISKEFKIFIL